MNQILVLGDSEIQFLLYLTSVGDRHSKPFNRYCHCQFHDVLWEWAFAWGQGGGRMRILEVTGRMGQVRGSSLDHQALPGFSTGGWIYF